MTNLEGGRDKDNLKGEAGNDYLNAVDGTGANDKVDGGEETPDTSTDTCVIDAGDSVRTGTTDTPIADQAAANATTTSSCEKIYVVPVPQATAATTVAGTT
jgi:hypothetical protein